MIETQRLFLSKPTRADFDIFQEILSCPIQTRFLPNEAPYPTEQQEACLRNRISHWQEHRFGTFIVALKKSPDVKIGFAGVEYAPNPDYVDIRFGVTKTHEGTGYATEASRAVLSWLCQNTDLKKVYGVAMTDNVASKAIFKKLGMQPEPDVDLYNCEGLDNFSIELVPV